MIFTIQTDDEVSGLDISNALLHAGIKHTIPSKQRDDATEVVKILTKIYGMVNIIKVYLSFKDIAGAFRVVNEISEYLVSIDVSQPPSLLDRLQDGGKKPDVVIFDDIHDEEGKSHDY